MGKTQPPVGRDGQDVDAYDAGDPAEHRIAEPAAAYRVSAPAISLGKSLVRLPPWMGSVPGFRSGRPWKMLIASALYLWILSRPQADGRAGMVFAMLALLAIAAAFDVGRARSRLPLLRSANPTRRLSGWVGLGAAAGISLLSMTSASPSESGSTRLPEGSGRGPSVTGPGGSVATTVEVRATVASVRWPSSSTRHTSTAALTDESATVAAAAVSGRDDAAPTTANGIGTVAPTDGQPATELLPVSQVVDGDTLKVVRAGRIETIRLIGIDSPEVGGGRTQVECFGQEASRRAADLLDGARVLIQTDDSQDERDHYGRLLAYVWLEDGTFVNLALVADGYAHEYTYDLPYRFQAEFKAAEIKAEASEVGLWSPATCGGLDQAVTVSTSAPAPDPTIEPAVQVDPVTRAQPAATAPPRAGLVEISEIHFDGAEPRKEGDEYAQVTNRGEGVVNLQGWRLNAGNAGQNFAFPSFELQPGQSCRVYTNQINADSCGGSFGSGKALWNNKGDCGHLFDSTGAQVSERCY